MLDPPTREKIPSVTAWYQKCHITSEAVRKVLGPEPLCDAVKLEVKASKETKEEKKAREKARKKEKDAAKKQEAAAAGGKGGALHVYAYGRPLCMRCLCTGPQRSNIRSSCCVLRWLARAAHRPARGCEVKPQLLDCRNACDKWGNSLCWKVWERTEHVDIVHACLPWQQVCIEFMCCTNACLCHCWHACAFRLSALSRRDPTMTSFLRCGASCRQAGRQ